MTLDLYQKTIINTILITTIMITLLKYILKGYKIVSHTLYQKRISKYENQLLNNHFLLKLINFIIKLHLVILYMGLIYVVTTFLLSYTH